MSPPVEIRGRCDSRFERVREGFAREHRLSLGCVMNLMHQGLWLADPRPRRLLAEAYTCL